jgi:hypothetical protein
MTRALLRCVFAAVALAAPSLSPAQNRPAPAAPHGPPARPAGPGRLALAAAQSAVDEVILPRVEVRARRGAPAAVDETARGARNARLCLRPVVTVRRLRNAEMPTWTGPLTDCTGRPTVAALAAVSLLAQPGRFTEFDVDAAVRELRRVAPAAGLSLADETAPRARARVRSRGAAPSVARDALTHDPVIMLTRNARVLHPRVIQLMQGLFDRFPGRVAEIVSGYRPGEGRSRHAHARALDLRLRGVRHEDVRDYARTLPDAGVGYYPNSVFVHLDTRDAQEGGAFWTDFSGPGEAPRYGHWPPTDQDVRSEVEWMVNDRDADLTTAREREWSPEVVHQPPPAP